MSLKQFLNGTTALPGLVISPTGHGTLDRGNAEAVASQMDGTGDTAPASLDRIRQALNRVEEVQLQRKLDALDEVDPWSLIASRLTGIPVEELTDELRERGKRAGHAWARGADDETLTQIFFGDQPQPQDPTTGENHAPLPSP